MSPKLRRLFAALFILIFTSAGAIYQHVQDQKFDSSEVQSSSVQNVNSSPAVQALQTLPVKGKAPKTGYLRKNFSDGWAEMFGCDVRNYVLKRDMTAVITRSEVDCTVMQGTLQDPYTGKAILFVRGAGTSDDVQIDHVVALSNAWQTGAQQLTQLQRHGIANDPLNLLAVDGPTNQQKGDADAATWLPPNKDFRCRYVARQIAVKQKYTLWVTQAEHDAMVGVLSGCPGQVLPLVSD